MRAICIVSACLLLLVSNVCASPEFSVNPVPEGTEITWHGNAARQDCLIGNLNDPTHYITFDGLFWIKHVVWPSQPDCSCDNGFDIENVHVFLVSTNSVPVNMEITVDLETSSWNEQEQCWYPGAVECQSTHIVSVIPGSNEFVLNLRDQCGCADLSLDEPYMISAQGDLVAGVYPMASFGLTDECTSFFYDYEGQNWYELNDLFPFPDYAFMLRASVDCCEFPVSSDSQPWGSLKSLFR